MSLSLYEPEFGGIKVKIEVNASEVKYPEILMPLSPDVRALMQGKAWPQSRIVNCPELDPVVNDLLPFYKIQSIKIQTFRCCSCALLSKV